MLGVSLPINADSCRYKKAFDSAETNAVLQAVLEQGVNPSYVVLLKKISSDKTTQINLFSEPIKITLRKGVRQGPELFAACLESLIRRLDWADSGIFIGGRRLDHLRFADDIVPITHTIDEPQRMLEELQRESSKWASTSTSQKPSLCGTMMRLRKPSSYNHNDLKKPTNMSI